MSCLHLFEMWFDLTFMLIICSNQISLEYHLCARKKKFSYFFWLQIVLQQQPENLFWTSTMISTSRHTGEIKHNIMCRNVDEKLSVLHENSFEKKNDKKLITSVTVLPDWDFIIHKLPWQLEWLCKFKLFLCYVADAFNHWFSMVETFIHRPPWYILLKRS